MKLSWWTRSQRDRKDFKGSNTPRKQARGSARLGIEQLERRDVPAQLAPDLMVGASYMNGWYTQGNGSGGTEIRFGTEMRNGGLGAFEIRGTKTYIPDPDHPGEQLQLVKQRVYNSDGSFTDRDAGYFEYHPEHGHVHFTGFAQARLRYRIAAGDANNPNDDIVGDVARSGDKTSFCLLDIVHWNAALAGSPSNLVYNSCGRTSQGISVGWADRYSPGLEGQSVDITGVANGLYWLEIEADPNNSILESNETNNITRIPITLGNLSISGFAIASSSPLGSTAAPVNHVEVNFNSKVNLSSFTPADVQFTGPNGVITVTGITAINGTRFNIDFAAQTQGGTYVMNIGPNILDKTGRLMDQNNNGTGGETADVYVNIFAIPDTDAVPRVASMVRNSANPTGAASVEYTVTFTENVTGVDVKDFAVFASGLTGVTVASVTGSDGTYVVTVNTGSGSSGKVWLNLVDNDSIIDASGNVLGGAGAVNGDFNGPIYKIVR